MRARALFSAKTTELGYLSRLQYLLARFAAGEINQADFVMWAQRYLGSIGYDPEAEGAAAGSLQDRSSERRLKLILDTNVRQGRSAAKMAASQDPDVLASWPAWRLVRVGTRRNPRQDWPGRWHAAGEATGWDGAARGQMVALKCSPIWAAIGNGAGGYTDTLGAPYPPFAFGSGLGWDDVGLDEATRLGLRTDNRVPDARIAPEPNEYQKAYDRLPADLQAQAKAWLEGGL